MDIVLYAVLGTNLILNIFFIVCACFIAHGVIKQRKAVNKK